MKNMMLLCDFYKICHKNMYPNKLSKLYYTWTPRSGKYANGSSFVVWFGLQGFLKTLIANFDEFFFNRPWDEVEEEYLHYIRNTFDEDTNCDHLKDLHKLGYLPLKICALPEGMKVPHGVPCATIENTHPDFAWLTNYLETIWSCSMWMPTTSATTAYQFKTLIQKYVDETSDNQKWTQTGCGDFSFRGMGSLESAITSAAGFLTSFRKTSTIPSIQYLCDFYNADVTKEDVGSWSASVEHSCTTSNFAVDGDEETFFKKMITELYPNKPFSFVADSYDYFEFLDKIVRNNRELIKDHSGKILIRPDSGDPEKIICGVRGDVPFLESEGTLRILNDIFGHTINSKGYKVLNDVGIVYGDAITLDRCKSICERTKAMGYSVENIVFGVGSYSMQYVTRDTHGFAYKATYGEVDGKPILIYKDPKTDYVNGKSMKKSQRGMVSVFKNQNARLTFKDGLYPGMITTSDVKLSDSNLLEPVFVDGKIVKETSLAEIRERIDS